MMRVPSARLLPVTSLLLATLLAIKSVALIRAAPTAPERAEVLATATSAMLGPARAASHDPAGASAPRVAVAPAGPVATQTPSATPPASPEPEAAPVSDSERVLLLELRQRRQELDAREAALATRESVLSAADRRLSARVDELQSLQSRLEALEAARKDRDEANWRGLVKLYESMKPRDAAAIFNDLDMPVLLAVVDRMKEAKAAPVLAAMQTEKARQVTAELAQMRTRANEAPSGG